MVVSVPKNKISFISIEMSLYDEMTVYDYLHFFAEIYEVDNIEVKINEFAEKLNFKEHLKHKIHGLSTGNKQKILMTRALINEPELLILDEPTNGLDVIISYEIRKLIKELQGKGATTIICSHLAEDLNMSERVIMINQGEIIEDKVNSGDMDIYSYFIEDGKK
ncbi:hypothetical protein Hs30E_06340 [Lactococcus hodotermopsidis]|uniref:ABC transporter domain-containing protein n=1 Tax=Pseudolactococcus hodotermopsidis TaxID=2709157 RepID=A0A6A0BBM7_9LACT|nr:hypothetical protein Hs30E_06340 [Lactococcus hodotermopsidis]